MARIDAYHVSSEPNLDVIRRGICDSEARDGLLYGANVASFTTTTYRGGLPDFSPYPCRAEEGEEVYRYVKQFNPANYFKFQMAKTDGQVHYLLLRTNSVTESVVCALLRLCIPENEDLEWDHYFPDGHANDYSPSHNRYVGEKVFVNVMFWHDVRVTESDTTVKRGPSFYNQPVEAVGIWLERLLQRARRDDDDVDDVDDLTRAMGNLAHDSD